MEHFSASLAGGNHKEGTNARVSNLLLHGVSDLHLLPSLLDLNRQLCIIKQAAGDTPEHGLTDSSFKCHTHKRRTAQTLSSALLSGLLLFASIRL